MKVLRIGELCYKEQPWPVAGRHMERAGYASLRMPLKNNRNLLLNYPDYFP